MKVWLSVDWDYFIREDDLLWDFGHREAPFFRDAIWPIRVAGLTQSGIDLRKEMNPDIHSTPRPERFVQELKGWGFEFKNAILMVSDSHAFGIRFGKLTKDASLLIHFDAHHDCGYSSAEDLRKAYKYNVVDCANWIYHLMREHRKLKTRVVYPPWKGLMELKYAQGINHLNRWRKSGRIVMDAWSMEHVAVEGGAEVTGVILSRSSAWTPPWLDSRFGLLVNSFEEACDMEAYPVEGAAAVRPRSFDYDACVKQAKFLGKLPKGIAMGAVPVSMISGGG